MKEQRSKSKDERAKIKEQRSKSKDQRAKMKEQRSKSKDERAKMKAEWRKQNGERRKRSFVRLSRKRLFPLSSLLCSLSYPCHQRNLRSIKNEKAKLRQIEQKTSLSSFLFALFSFTLPILCIPVHAGGAPPHVSAGVLCQHGRSRGS